MYNIVRTVRVQSPSGKLNFCKAKTVITLAARGSCSALVTG